MAEVGRLLGRQNLPQLPLHLQRVLGPVGKSQAAGDADAVGIADVGGLTEHVSQNQIGRLAAHAGQGGEFFHGPGNLAAVALHKLLGAGDNIPGLAVVEAAGVDVLPDFGRVRLGKALQSGEAGVEGGRDFVDPLIRALGGKPHGKQKLIVLVILQGAQSVGIELLECFDDPLERRPWISCSSPRV